MAKTANGRRRLRPLAIAFTLLLPLLANAATTIIFLHPSTMTEEEKI